MKDGLPFGGGDDGIGGGYDGLTPGGGTDWINDTPPVGVFPGGAISL